MCTIFLLDDVMFSLKIKVEILITGSYNPVILDLFLYILITVCATVHSSREEKLDFGHFEE